MTDKQTVKFGDICKEVKLTTKDPIGDGYERYIGLEHLDSGSLKIKRWGMIAEDNPSFTRVFKKGQILFGKRRPYLKKAAIAEFDGICSSDIIVLESKNDDVVLKEFLPFIVQSNYFWGWAIKTSSGSLSPRTKFKLLADCVLKKLDLYEQRSLLNQLLRLAENEEKIQETLSSAFQLKRVLLSKLLSMGSGDDCRQVKLKEVIEIQSGQVDPKHEPYINLPHIAPDNMEKATGRLLEYRTAYEDAVTSGKYYFDSEWILYSKIRPNLRKLCNPGFSGVCSADVYPIKGKNGLLTDYLFYLLQSEHFNQYAISTSTRSGFPKINRDDLGAYKFLLPGKEYQKQFVKRLQELDQVIENLIISLGCPLQLRNSILDSEIS
ncbi:restriction endonuclease subunit S [Vibrio vulnificus]|uniref:restriction endonuclease subunit S n=1 Tax=Vibrio vulnificus TaxID=672 RepID=UPI00285A0A9F|nr:restriction endonuclease subunit S [Vibrio vulnificus]ELE2042652.1 restriction endonuclease subunit S [Vibrio vulnificus]MDS1832301.1 restriction endonuclease subunit S [Vibrio vulnificus]